MANVKMVILAFSDRRVKNLKLMGVLVVFIGYVAVRGLEDSAALLSAGRQYLSWSAVSWQSP
jgi:hypothetical protein